LRQRKHGSLIVVSLTVSPVKNAEGKIVGASKTAPFQEDADALTTWYSGWYNGLAKKHFLDFKKGKETEHEAILYCKAHLAIGCCSERCCLVPIRSLNWFAERSVIPFFRLHFCKTKLRKEVLKTITDLFARYRFATVSQIAR
jgi:hypothetical protein